MSATERTEREARSGQRETEPSPGTAPAGAIRIVMIGCGGFARRYHVPAILEDPAVSIAAVCDPTPAAETQALAARYGAPVLDAIAAMPADVPGPGAPVMSIVTTPHTLHAAHVQAVVERGWHTLVDKPFVMRTAEARALARLATDNGVVNAVAFNRRFDRGCLRARALIAAGAIGAVRFVQTVQLGYERAGWFLVPALGGGGPYTGRATHMADIVPWLIGRRPVRLRSRVRGGTQERSDRGGFIELQFDDLECQMTCIEEGWHMWDEIRVFGDDGLIELRRPLTQPIGWGLRWSSRRGEAGEWLAADPRPGDATRDFFAALREPGAAVACSFAEAIPSVEIVEQAFASAAAGGDWITLVAQHPEAP